MTLKLNKAFGWEMPVADRQRWLQWTILGYEMFSMLEQPHYGERAVVLKETEEMIGAVGIVPYLDTFNSVTAFQRTPDFPATAEVGLFWVIAPDHQRNGSVSEAARALTDYLFNKGYKTHFAIDHEVFESRLLFRRFANIYSYARILRAIDQVWENEPDWLTQLRLKLNGALRKRSAHFGETGS